MKVSPSSSLAWLFLASTLTLIEAVDLTTKPKGIVVPKRAALIAGLNQQFKSRQAQANSTSGQSSSSSSGANKSLLAAAGAQLVGLVAPSTSAKSKRQPQKASLHVDRQQQELLAANPSLLNAPNSALVTRSDIAAVSGQQQQQQQEQQQHVNANQAAGHRPAASDVTGGQAAMTGALHSLNQQQLYRGYSLIELEVKSESDRRYVQELYGNLSAALNEQALGGASSGGGGGGSGGATRLAGKQSPLAVSPYADIDFWSFKCALNDQIDIMVSPKSRAFIMNQLNRAKIKHRVKIDDIQSRLDQTAPLVVAGGGSSNQFMGPAELSGRQSSVSSSGAPTTSELKQPAPVVVVVANNQADHSTRNQQQHLVGRHELQQGGQPLGADPMAGTSHMNDSLFFENYQRLNEINQYVESIVARARDVAKVQVIGRSSQGRYLRVLRLGYEQRDVDGSTSDRATAPSDGLGAAAAAATGQPASPPAANNASRILDNFYMRHQNVKKLGSIWLDGGTHAREWISPATVLYMAFRLSDNHARCVKFFDYLNMVVNQVTSSSVAGRAAPLADHTVDANLLNGINEINTSLLGGQAAKPRHRSEFEQKLEVLAKRPQEIASEHSCDLDMEQLLRRYTFYVMPVLNPDGYEYSHTHNRLWRKTRSTSNHPIYRHFCLGADPNRNYDARHGSTGSSSHPCSQTYGGTTPFTEPETRHQSNFVYAHRGDMKMFISFHSYSQMILLPFSHSKQLAPDHKDLESVGQAAVKAIERTHGTQYRVGPSASILYTASGTASDWAYEKAGIKYSYTIELRDTGTYGFLLPRQQIIPTGEETFNGLLAMIGQMEKNDNLLTSKSLLLSSQQGQPNATQQPADFVHAPDLDQLRPFNRFRPRPAQLENALDGTNTWATAQPPMLGVRDRKPAAATGNGDDVGSFVAKLDEPSDSYAPGNRIEEETIVTPSEEPDAGYAFEGEGELMEPTSNELDMMMMSAARHQQESQQDKLIKRSEQAQLYGHMHAHSAGAAPGGHETGEDNQLFGSQNWQRFGPKQMPSAMSLSANGRNLINSPPLPSRTTASLPRRESSEDVVVVV